MVEKTKNTLFTGCSYTHGNGFDDLIDSEYLWVNLFHKSNPLLANTNLVNASLGGISNQEIFLRTVKHLTSKQFDYAFVQWTSMYRMEIHTGLETYSTKQLLLPHVVPQTHNLNDVTIEGKYIAKIKDRLFSIMHTHYQIVKVLEYVNILINLAKVTNTKIYFINGLCPWDKDFFILKENFKPNYLTKYTQELINVENRDDIEIEEIYKKMHKEYAEKGGVRADYWINLDFSYENSKVDVNSDNIHPGIQSNKNYAELLNKKLKLNKIVLHNTKKT